MALQSSGSISMSDIAGEFGGSGSHSLSEYHALSGLGVSGIPSSGQISLANFHGKSNQVSTQTWVSSGYNETVWNTMYSWTYPGGWNTGGNYVQKNPQGTYYIGLSATQTPYYSNGPQGDFIPYSNPLYYGGNRRLVLDSAWHYFASGHTAHNFHLDESSTQWVDTSQYETTTITVQIST